MHAGQAWEPGRIRAAGQPGGKRHARALEGPIDEADYGVPRFRSCRFAAAYPLGQVELADPDLPVTAVVQGFNPLIPGDVGASSIPAAILRFVVTNTSAASLRVAVCGTIANFIGFDGTLGAPAGNRNEYRERAVATPVRGILLSSEGAAVRRSPRPPCHRPIPGAA